MYVNVAHYADATQMEMFGDKPTKEEFVNEFLKFINWKDYETRHSNEEGTGNADGSAGGEQGAQEEVQREIEEGVKILAVEITKQVGEDLVVTDDKEAERVIKENETEIDGNERKRCL